MNDIRAKVAYLQGLAEGLDVETASAEGRLLSSVINVLDEIADQITEISVAQGELTEYVEDLDYDLGALEESVYADGDVAFTPDESMAEEEQDLQLISCPECGETLAAGFGDIDTELDGVCPSCGCLLCHGASDLPDEMVMDHD